MHTERACSRHESTGAIRPTIDSWPGWISLAWASLLALAILLTAGIASAEGEQRSLGFSKLLFRIDGNDAIGVTKGDFRIGILQELRNQGFAALGAESLVLSKDLGQKADLLLGGTVSGLECRTVPEKGGACRLAIEWELLDTRRDAVVYRALTRAAAYRIDFEKPAGAASFAVLGALRSLTQRAAFRSQLARAAESDAGATPATSDGPPLALPKQDIATGFVDFADPLPSFDPEGDAQRAQAAAKQRATQEFELQQRMATEARDAQAKEHSKQSEALTPGYLKVMKWGGAGLAVAGGIAAIATYSAFDRQKSKEADYDRLRLGNDLAWAAMALGAASFALSFALTPSLPKTKSAMQGTLAVDLGPGQVQARLCF